MKNKFFHAFLIAIFFIGALITNVFAGTTPPDKITVFSGEVGLQVKLTWSATGDDGDTGDVTGGRFQIKYSSSPSATPDTAEYDLTFSSSWAPGSSQSKIITTLVREATNYLWIRSADEASNWSVWSDSVSVFAGSFSEEILDISAPGGLYNPTFLLCDYDNDDDLDIILGGNIGAGNAGIGIYRNDSGVYSLQVEFDQVASRMCVGDYDN
ncbi:MAG: hypothetical protein ABH857_01670, partial [Elusimicrobiota bacterium]